MAHTYGNHAFSRVPQAASPHCHPAKLPPHKLHGQSPSCSIAMEALSSFAKLDATGAIEIPEFCFLCGENLERTLVLSELLNATLLTCAVSAVAPSTSQPDDPHLLCDPSSFHHFLKNPPPLRGNFALANSSQFLRMIAHQVYSFPLANRTPFDPASLPAVCNLLSLAIFLEVVGTPEPFFEHYQSHSPTTPLTSPPFGHHLPDKCPSLPFIFQSPSTLIRKFQIHLEGGNTYNEFRIEFMESAQVTFAQCLKRTVFGKPVHSRSVARAFLSTLIIESSSPPSDCHAACTMLASLAMSAIEEIFSDLFQPPTVEDFSFIAADPACQPCLEMIYQSGLTNHPAKAAVSLLQKLNNQSEQFLSCVGAKKHTGEVFARWSTNSRPVDASDIHSILSMVRSCCIFVPSSK